MLDVDRLTEEEARDLDIALATVLRIYARAHDLCTQQGADALADHVEATGIRLVLMRSQLEARLASPTRDPLVERAKHDIEKGHIDWPGVQQRAYELHQAALYTDQHEESEYDVTQ